MERYLLSEESHLQETKTSHPVKPISDRIFTSWAAAGNKIDAFAEFCLLCMPVSETLLTQGGCIFHAAAFTYRGKAWLIAAGSGVGKSTQIRTLIELYPEEIAVINGDKPALFYEPAQEKGETPRDFSDSDNSERLTGHERFGATAHSDQGKIIVYPSPWNGKEGWHGAAEAELAGIFVLRRGEENAIVPMTAKQAAPHILSGIFQSYENEEMIRSAAIMAEHILESAPVWLLTNLGVPESTRLLYETMRRVMDNEERGYFSQG